MNALLGISIRMTPSLEDGKVIHLGHEGALLIGTHKLSEHREEARRIVREGLADVLAWLGEPVHPPTGEQVWASLKAASVPEPRYPIPSPIWAATQYDPATADPIGDIKAAMAAFKGANRQ